MSIASNIIYAITGIHCCFSSNIINCCDTCFAQIEMQFFYGLASTRIERKAALYSKGFTACKQTY